jgi:hypothetical protein
MLLRVAAASAGSSGLAILVGDILQHLTADSELEAKTKQNPRGRRSPLLAEAPCSACRLARGTEECYVNVLSKAEEGSAPFEGIRREGRGICVPHLITGLALLSKHSDARARYLACFRHGSEELIQELAGLARKQDYRYQHEGLTDGEASSWRRGVYRLVGEPLPTREPPR